ncbi:MAG: hypothetical protein HQ581_00545 [Planctomycetes bacterium]|nr:hypothetical protein [Planctomycetota bacterium]
MAKNRLARFDRLMRALHLYTSMFLVPWMMIYAISAFLIHHKEWFGDEIQPKWEASREIDFDPGPAFPRDSEDQAQTILEHLDLDGAHSVVGNDPGQLVIHRNSATGFYRIIWKREQSRLIVQKQQPVTFYSFVNALHFQHGYFKPRIANLPWLIWGIVVDAVTICTVLWVITGIYIWARRPRKRLLGGLCLVAGSLLFAVLAILMCG